MNDTINGITPEEIKLDLLADYGCCSECEYGKSTQDRPYGCAERALKGQAAENALAYIQQLEREREQIKRVRDAAVKDIEDAAPCFACIRFERNGGDCIGARVCIDDVLQEAVGGRYADYCFEWRGAEVE